MPRPSNPNKKSLTTVTIRMPSDLHAELNKDNRGLTAAILERLTVITEIRNSTIAKINTLFDSNDIKILYAAFSGITMPPGLRCKGTIIAATVRDYATRNECPNVEELCRKLSELDAAQADALMTKIDENSQN